ncbi:MAG: 4-hydroxyphenylacetate 3-hydroxylase N-terminal domain-containing protein, partial [Geminicoccaceae bacterium]|nr:4-hydroxyphenylacetate 3-hydroxylase N-terminal domain-containing protein [Geminicoccaceae bacterium]
MLRTGDDYRDSIRDGREVWIDGERVVDVPAHPAFKPIVDARARIYDMAHEQGLRERLTFADPASGERLLEAHKLPRERADWERKREAVDATLYDLGGVVIR